MTFGKIAGLPGAARARFDRPAQVKTFEDRVDLANTLFIVSSKSGSTLEPNIFKQYFFDRVEQLVGARRPAAASSPSPIPARSCSRSPRRDGFRHVFFGWPTSAGATRRCPISAWSRPPSWAWTWRSFLDPDRGDGLRLHAVGPGRGEPGRRARRHPRRRREPVRRDKVTIVASPGICRPRRLAGAAAGGVDGQGRQGPDPDRSRSARPRRRLRRRPLFVYLRLRSAPDAAQDEASTSWNAPVIRSCASSSTTRTTSARSSSAGRSPPPWPGPSSASTRSISRTSKPARSRRGS